MTLPLYDGPGSNAARLRAAQAERITAGLLRSHRLFHEGVRRQAGCLFCPEGRHDPLPDDAA